MRNLKRALSMAMASVMLMGMSVVGTSAASVSDFSDVDSINNLEAVSIATGLGIFDGYDDGEFKPERVVTRAEMAVVIAKILHGADVDPATFVGDSKFTDVPAWAEGYVNLCDSLGIIEGYGDGKFGPNDPVTTVQANIMLLKALGYYTHKEDNLPANWGDAQLEATSKATALGIVSNDMGLPMNAGLTREDVAELTFNALFAQRVGFDDDRGLHVKANDRNVIVTNGTKDVYNTLAQNTFGLYAVEGTVIANGMTDEALSEDLKSEEQTRVLFTEATDLDQDGKAEMTAGKTYDFEVATGLDMIGHAAKVYYKIEKKAPVVFALVDQATLVDYITYDANSTNLAKAANAAGFKKNTILDVDKANYLVNYDWDVKYGNATWADTLVVISNSVNKEVDCVIALDQYLDVVDSITVKEDETDIDLQFRAEGSDMTVAATDLAEKDYVIVTDIGNQGKVKVLEAANVTSATITKLIGKTNANTDVTGVVADGETYKISTVDGQFVTKNFVEFKQIATIDEATLVLDQFGKLIGLATEPVAPNYAYVAQFGQRHSTTGLNTDTTVWTAHVYFADGTNGIYEIDTDKSSLYNTTSLLGSSAYDTAAEANAFVDAKNNITGANGADGIPDNEAYYEANSGLKGLYNVKVLPNGKVEIDNITATHVDDAVKQPGAKVYKSHSTLVDLDGDTDYEYGNANSMNVAKVQSAATVDADDVLYQNDDTVYFFVTGAYQDMVKGVKKNTLKVTVVTGVKNVENFTNSATDAVDNTISVSKANNDKYWDLTTNTDINKIGTGIKDGYADVKDDADLTDGLQPVKDIIATMLVQGVVAESETLYYYDEGNYEVDPVDGGYTLTYYLYAAETGEAYSVTYDNDGKKFATVADAKTWAATKADGFYKVGATDITGVYVDNSANGQYLHLNGNVSLEDALTDYVINDKAQYDEIIDNLFSPAVAVGSIFDENTVIVNLTTAELNTLEDIIEALDPNTTQTPGDIKLSYAIKKGYDVDVLFVTEYTPDGTQAPGGNVNYNGDVASVTLAKNGTLVLNLKGAVKNATDYTYTLYTRNNNTMFDVAEDVTVTVPAGLTQVVVDVDPTNAWDGVSVYAVVDGVKSNTVVLDSSAPTTTNVIAAATKAPVQSLTEAKNQLANEVNPLPLADLVSLGLTNKVENGIIKLSGTVTELKDTLTDAQKDALNIFWGSNINTIAAVKSAWSLTSATKIGFVMVTVGNESKVLIVKDDGTGVKLAQSNVATKSGYTIGGVSDITIDLTGLSF